MLTRESERGQAIILFVGVFTVVLVIAAIVVDFGLWFAERRSAQRAADLAAAAGAQDLPLDPAGAYASACSWAIDNGAGGELTVEIFERGSAGSQQPCGQPAPPVPACGPNCNTLRVTARGPGPLLFSNVFGIGNPDIGAVAAAGLTSTGGGGVGGVGPDQTVFLAQVHPRLSQRFDFCVSFPPPEVCAFDLILAEAEQVVDTLAAGAGAEVGYAPYTHCYQPEPAYPQLDGRAGCVPTAWVVPPTSDSGLLEAAIDGTTVVSGGIENICLALMQAQDMLAPQSEGRRQSIILISDGDNRFRYTSFFQQISYPPDDCRPELSTDQPSQGRCDPPAWRERELDELTLEKADELNAAGVDIYVVAVWSDFEPCGLDELEAGLNCSTVGDNAHDNIANERLLRCIATSPEHYQSVNFVNLPGAIDQIVSEIVSRSLLQ